MLLTKITENKVHNKKSHFRVLTIKDNQHSDFFLKTQCFKQNWLNSRRCVFRHQTVSESPAGGLGKNRKADLSLRLPAGDYRLHYQSDESRAYMESNDAAPDHLFWGIHFKLQ